MTKHEDWLKLTVEETIEAELPIVDAHHHIHPKYVLKDFLLDIGDGHNITKTVFVEDWILYLDTPEKMEPWRETEWIVAETARIKSRAEVAAGIVGYADLASGSVVAPVLESHIAVSQRRFRGIRFVIHFGDNPPRVQGLLSDRQFREGVAALHKYNLCYDTMVHYSQLPELVDLAKAFPDMPIIINHIGMPTGTGPSAPNRDEVLEVWQRGITVLSPYPNLYIKLGGLTMSLFGFGWNGRPAPPGSDEMAKVMAPYYLYCIEQVGVHRCMFESNFPPDKASTSYNILWNAFKRITAGFSDEERRALFHDTAAKVYSL